MNLRRRVLVATAALVACASLRVAAQAPVWPAGKTLRIVVPSAAGGASDLVARLLADKLSIALSVPVVVENKPGSGNVIGTAYVAKAPPDGTTFLLTYTDHVFNPYMYSRLPFDAVRDFVPVAYVGSVPQVLVVNNGVGAANVRELIALAKARPGALNFGSVGAGSSLHLAGEAFRAMAKVDVVHVPYKGGPAATVGLIAGETQLLFPTLSSVRTHIQSGQIRALAIGRSQRSSKMPELPTVAEAGLPGYEAAIWYGLIAPAGVPRAVVERVNAEVNKALTSPDVAGKLDEQGFTLSPGTPEQFGERMRADGERWGRIIKEANFKLD